MIVKIDDISKKVAENNDEKEEVVREINRSQWRQLHEVMQSGTLQSVKLMYLGKFSKKLKNNYFNDKNKRDISGVQESDI